MRSGGKSFDWLNADDERPDFLKVRSISNLIARALKKPNMRYYTDEHPRQTIPIRSRARPMQVALLSRITNKEGLVRRLEGKKQEYQKTCFVCRQYSKKPVNTVWWCSTCHMPLCKMPRKREMTCMQEHQIYHDDPHLGCFANREYFFMPPEYRKFLEPVSKLTCTNQSSVHNNNENDGDDESDGDFMIGNMDGGEDDVGSLSSNDSLLSLLRTSSGSSSRRGGGAATRRLTRSSAQLTQSLAQSTQSLQAQRKSGRNKKG